MAATTGEPQYTIEQLVAVNPYNPDILPELEDYVEEQVATQAYSLDANLCLLRLYQFQPKRLNPNIVTKILVKALMALPAQDFSQCMFLLPEKHMSEENLTLVRLSHLLETCRFRDFWDEAAKHREVLAIPGFEEAIQRFGEHVLMITYKKVPRHVLAETINVEGISLDKYLESRGWKVQMGRSGPVVTLPSNEHNTPNLKKSAGDNVSLDSVAKLFPVLT